MTHSYMELVNIAADGAMTARTGDGESTWPILSQDERGQSHARHIAASVLDALIEHGVIEREQS